jgi:peptidoglycan/LPS O-acetylase OafA/YrhL
MARAVAKSLGARIPGLDGLRGVSIVLVVLCHYYASFGLPRSALTAALAGRASFGVTIFFLISGFLISSLLLEEEARFGGISLKYFYLRRSFRILPAAFVYLFIVALLSVAGILHAQAAEILAALGFFRNLVDGNYSTGHYWSLSIEEQFYVLWPAMLVLIKSPRLRIQIVASLIAWAPLWRQWNYHIAHGAQNVNSLRFDLRYDALLKGCLLALLRQSPATGRILDVPWLRHWLTPSASGIVLVGIVGFDLVPPHCHAVIPTLSFALVAVWINFAVAGGAGPINQVLESRVLVWIGSISYSLYLWQQLFATASELPELFLRFPQNFVLSLAAATLSYRFVEQPWLRLRNRFKRPTGSRVDVSPCIASGAALGRYSIRSE